MSSTSGLNMARTEKRIRLFSIYLRIKPASQRSAIPQYRSWIMMPSPISLHGRNRSGSQVMSTATMPEPTDFWWTSWFAGLHTEHRLVLTFA